MQTFTFDQLDERGQRSAERRYGLYDHDGEQETLTIHPNFYTSWRFTEHGERVA